jgi:hypothetical protein
VGLQGLPVFLEILDPLAMMAPKVKRVKSEKEARVVFGDKLALPDKKENEVGLGEMVIEDFQVHQDPRENQDCKDCLDYLVTKEIEATKDPKATKETVVAME